MSERGATTPKLSFHAVDSAHWADFERLFESRGAPKYCWCMVWRATPEEGKLTGNANRKAAMHQRVKDKVPVGLLAYADDEPVGWCSIAPRDTYRRLVKDDTSDDDGVWAISCFFIKRELRGQGMTKRLLAAALKHARAHGAMVVEAYPVDADSPSYRFMGFVPMFEQAKFHEIGREGTRRHVMRRKLRAAKSS